LTYTSLVLAAVAGVAAATQHFVMAALILMASGMCDMLDGVVARATNTVSPFGALLDSTVDRFADGLPLLGLVVVYADHGWLASVPALAMLGGLVVSYVRARAESLGARLPALFMRRAERVVLLTLSLLLGVVSLSLSVPAPLLLLGVSVIGLLSLIGVVFALRAARLALGEQHGAEADGPPVSVLDVEASAR
jgi:phosphatidylglycerophosphate synthase